MLLLLFLISISLRINEHDLYLVIKLLEHLYMNELENDHKSLLHYRASNYNVLLNDNECLIYFVQFEFLILRLIV